MSSSREDSPDWLRSFQPPTQSAICLSSGSESPLNYSPVSDDDEDSINLSKLFKKEANQVIKDDNNDSGRKSVVDKTLKQKSVEKNEKVKLTPGRRTKKEVDTLKQGNIAKGEAANRETPEKHGLPYERMNSIWALSSDSESCPDTKPTKNVMKNELSADHEDLATENKEHVMDDILLNQDEKSPKKQASKVNSPAKKEKVHEKASKKKNVKDNINGDNDSKNNVVKEDISRIHPVPQVYSSRLPLMVSEKVQKFKALVECAGDSIDLSGDVGAVGRIVFSDDYSKSHDMLLDLKGTIYKTTIVPSRTFCVVNFGQSEAKVEAIMNDYIQLEPQSNVYEAETMVEGTLEGFSFDSEDEAEKLPKDTAQANQPEDDEEHPAGKKKRKAQKTAVGGRNKGKATGGKSAKKVKKKPQVSKKTKIKK